MLVEKIMNHDTAIACIYYDEEVVQHTLGSVAVAMSTGC